MPNFSSKLFTASINAGKFKFIMETQADYAPMKYT